MPHAQLQSLLPAAALALRTMPQAHMGLSGRDEAKCVAANGVLTVSQMRLHPISDVMHATSTSRCASYTSSAATRTRCGEPLHAPMPAQCASVSSSVLRACSRLVLIGSCLLVILEAPYSSCKPCATSFHFDHSAPRAQPALTQGHGGHVRLNDCGQVK